MKRFATKKWISLLVLLLVGVILLSSCAKDNGDTKPKLQASPFPESAFTTTEKQGVIGSIVQTGDGNAYVSGTVPSPPSREINLLSSTVKTNGATIDNTHLVTFEHSLKNCWVNGYIGNSLYIIMPYNESGSNGPQDKYGIGHMDGTVILDGDENGYFSISSFSENKIIVGNPTDPSIKSKWDDTASYMFGYMVYNSDTKELVPMYKENNLRFYTAGYFINGVAMVSVKKGDNLLFGIIDSQGNYVVEPKYKMMADESKNNIAIVGLEADLCLGTSFERPILHDTTLSTLVQGTRSYNFISQSVGLINTLTGESVLPCSYSYIERVMDNTYFVIDNEGARHLYDVNTNSFTAVDRGIYTYFNPEWMLYIDDDGSTYLADKELKLYETTGLSLQGEGRHRYNFVTDCVNLNIISAVRDDQAKGCFPPVNASGFIVLPDRDPHSGQSYNITVTATGAVIKDVQSHTAPYNSGFLYTAENSLYRYDIKTNTSTRLETGYGNFTEDYGNRGATYHALVEELDTGVFLVYYCTDYSDGTSGNHTIIVNDKGTVLFDADIGTVALLQKNYLGKYDEALYEIAGSTQIEDNYYMTRSDGSHWLFQVVRGTTTDEGASQDSKSNYRRTFDNSASFEYLSPFMLDFEDGSEISVMICDKQAPSDYYVYNSETQSFKLLGKAFFDDDASFKWAIDGFFEIIVTSGEETITLRIESSPYSIYR